MRRKSSKICKNSSGVPWKPFEHLVLTEGSLLTRVNRNGKSAFCIVRGSVFKVICHLCYTHWKHLSRWMGWVQINNSRGVCNQWVVPWYICTFGTKFRWSGYVRRTTMNCWWGSVDCEEKVSKITKSHNKLKNINIAFLNVKWDEPLLIFLL